VIDRINTASGVGDASLVEPAIGVLTTLHGAWVELARRAP
jgi:hypothetical protein